LRLHQNLKDFQCRVSNSFGSDALWVKRSEIIDCAKAGIGVLGHFKNPDHQKRVRTRTALRRDLIAAPERPFQEAQDYDNSMQEISIETLVVFFRVNIFNPSTRFQETSHESINPNRHPLFNRPE
jgi:hypothetical protein